MRVKKIRTLSIVLLALSTLVFYPGLAKADDLASTYTNSIGMKFVLIPAGTFMMGAGNIGDAHDWNSHDWELPRHQITISKPFYLGVYEVTQKEWEAVMGTNPSKNKGSDNPVEMVSWEDVQVFIEHLNKKEGHSRYRLPTEAEWEYAARAGSTSAYFFGPDNSQLKDYAWYWDNSGDTTHPVGQKRPSAWGLYDMMGNVFEWTQDWYDDTYYANSPSVDPTGPISGDSRVVRGCGWTIDASGCRSAFRFGYEPAYRAAHFGFRLALSPEGSK
jgi:formylglycine-generating enzyme required for sulfatase activity